MSYQPNTQFNEDTAHTTGDRGTQILAVRNDANTALSGTDGDYTPVTVSAKGDVRVTGDYAHDEIDAGRPLKIGGRARSSAPADVAGNDRVDAYFDLKGRLKVDGSDVTQPISAATIEGLLTTIDADTSALAGTVAGTEVQVDVVAALPAGNNNIGDVDVASLPAVNFQDVYVTGQGSQLALGQNVILASAGTGSYDVQNGTTGISFRSWSIQIVPAAGTITAGVITFEGSNDNVNFTPIFLSDVANVTAIPVSTVTLAASTSRYFAGEIPFRYVRARISTGITGTTTGVQAFSKFSTVPFSSSRLTVSQATGASLNVAVSSAPSTAVTMAANATTTPAKAQDGVAGASDTGIPPLLVRRDTPTALTPVAGDYAFPQVSANGEQWVRLQGEVADDAAFTVGTTRIVPSGFLADETATDSVDEGDAGAARMTLDRKQIVASYAHTAGGWTPHMAISAASTNATSLKASAGQVGGFQVFNLNAAPRYLKLYNKASAPTVGTDTPVKVIMIPGNTAGAGAIMGSLAGVEFSSGIAYALTTGITNADTGAVAASEIAVNIDWK